MAVSAAIIVLLSQCSAAAGPRRTVEIRQPDGTYRTCALSRRASRAIVRSGLHKGDGGVALIRLFKADRCVVMRVSFPMPPAKDTTPVIRPKDVWQFAEIQTRDSSQAEKEVRL